MAKFTVVGSDVRFDHLTELMIKDGHSAIRVKGDEVTAILCLEGTLILPYPCVKNDCLNGTGCRMEDALSSFLKAKIIFAGSAPLCLIDFARKNKITLIDYAESEELLLANAALTAEAAIALIMGDDGKSLRGRNAIICGYGRIGRALSSLLTAFGTKLSVAVRSREARLMAEFAGLDAFPVNNMGDNLDNIDLIFNTVPSLVIDEKVLAKMNEGCRVIDLASSPGGVDFAAADRLEIKAESALGLPGKYAPYSAAELIKNAIYNLIEEEELLISGKM